MKGDEKSHFVFKLIDFLPLSFSFDCKSTTEETIPDSTSKLCNKVNCSVIQMFFFLIKTNTSTSLLPSPLNY